MEEVQILGQKALKAESYPQAAYPTTMGTERAVPALKEGSCPGCYFQSMSYTTLIFLGDWLGKPKLGGSLTL